MISVPKGTVEPAMELAVQLGYVGGEASDSEKLQAVISYAARIMDSALSADQDKDRADAIRASVLDGARHDLI